MSEAVAIDASVALAWLLGAGPEAGAAEALLRTTAEGRVPVLVSPAFHAAVITALHDPASGLSAGQAQQALTCLTQYPFQVVHTQGLYSTALKLAQSYQLPAYSQALSVAVAGLAGCELWTADDALLDLASGRLGHVRRLAAYGNP